LSNGGFVITWTSVFQDGDRGGIYAQVFNADGVRIGTELLVNTYTASIQTLSDVVGLNNGGFVIAWMSMNQDGDDYGIFAQIFTENGTKVGQEFRVNSYKKGWQYGPVLSNLSNSEFVISWSGAGRYGSGIYAKTFDEKGKAIGEDFPVKVGAESNSKKITSFSNGDFLVEYRENGTKGKYYLSEPIYHNLKSFELLEPKVDSTLYTPTPQFLWNNATQDKINLPYELTYDLYLDTDMSFLNPIIVNAIQDTTWKTDSLATGKTYFWKVLARNFYGDFLWSSNVNGFYIDPDAVTYVNGIDQTIPSEFSVEQNYPNPFNPTTTISYQIPEDVSINSASVRNYNVVLKVYDVLGRLVKVLVNETKKTRSYSVEFDGSSLSSGIYYYTVTAGEFSITKKMLLLK